jgi:hypothetical protein
LGQHHEFPGLKAFGRIEATREVDGKISSETRWFALSWQPAPDILLATVRDHWAIENALHWQLDVSFREDAARNRKDNAPGNIAVLRRPRCRPTAQVEVVSVNQAQACRLGRRLPSFSSHQYSKGLAPKAIALRHPGEGCTEPVAERDLAPDRRVAAGV